MTEYTSTKDINKIMQAFKSYEKIYICDNNIKTKYAPALFWINNKNKIFVYNSEIGRCEHSATMDEIKKHFENMLTEGFKIIVGGVTCL